MAATGFSIHVGAANCSSSHAFVYDFHAVYFCFCSNKLHARNLYSLRILENLQIVLCRVKKAAKFVVIDFGNRDRKLQERIVFENILIYIEFSEVL